MKGFARNLGQLSSANVFLTELLAISTALELIMGLDLPKVIVESNALEVILLLNSRDILGDRYENLASEILCIH